MIKTARRIVAVFCLICLVAGAVITPSFCCLFGDGSMTQEEMDKDVRYWRQGSVPADNSLIHSGTDRTIGRAACSHFAMSYALVKMGYLNPANGDTPITHIEKARTYNAFRVNWGYYEYAKAPEMYPGIEYVGVDFNSCGLSLEDGLTYVKGKMAEGYYVIACVSSNDTGGHMIFFDGINEDGTTSIGDSWFGGLTWEEYYGLPESGTRWDYLELLKCESAPFNEQPSIYDENNLRGANKEEVTEYQTLVEEKNLTGMPITSNLSRYARKPSFVGRDELSLEEQGNVESIKEAQNADKVTAMGIAGAISSFVGILCLSYAVILFLAFIFDSVNSFVDIDLVNLLTLGHIKVVRDKNDLEEGAKKKGYASIAKLFAIIIIVALFGISFVSGFFLEMVYKLTSKL